MLWWLKPVLLGMGITSGASSLFVGTYLLCDRLFNPPHGNTYHFQVSPKFTYEQQRLLAQAFTDWQRANPKLTITFAEGDCATKHNGVDACFMPTYEAENCVGAKNAVGCTRATANYAQVHIDVECGRADDEFYWLALHETGHVLGVGHSTDPASVMYPTTECK